MLSEVKAVKQESRTHICRWFHDEQTDLFVWSAPGRPTIGFQFTYTLDRRQKALSWFADKGYSHMNIDDGECTPPAHKMSPLLVPDGVFDKDRVLEIFRASCSAVDEEIITLVSRRIEEYPE